MRRSASLIGARAATLGATAALALLTACGGGPPAAPAGGGAGANAAAATPSASALPTCAAPVSQPYAWPKQVPQDLPKLPGATLGPTRQLASGLTIVQFSTATSLRDGVIFIVRKLPAAGYSLGRGDAEPAEADAPFAKNGMRGVLRGAAVAPCQTRWILAVTRQTVVGGSPLLPARPRPSPSALPFG